MTVAEVIKKMVEYSKGDLHDINHFMKVYAYRVAVDLRAGYVPGSPGSGYREDHHSVGRGTPSGT